MKIAIRGGHSLDVRGASGIVDEVTEDRKIALKVIEYLRLAGHEVLDVTPTNSGTSAIDLSVAVNKANTWGANYFASIHLNAYNGSAKGTEVLYASTKGKEYADRIVAKLANLGFYNRGSKQDVRGLYEFNHVVAPNNIVECFFCDNQTDVSLYKELGADKIALAIAEGIIGQTINITPVVPKKYYVVSNYVNQGQYGVELSSLFNKYFNGLSVERWYVKSNATGLWFETQYMSKENAQMLSDRLSVDGLLYKLVEE